ncbi:hypothetical protein PMIN03_005362 [Paraphaeosphaeria minitans]
MSYGTSTPAQRTCRTSNSAQPSPSPCFSLSHSLANMSAFSRAFGTVPSSSSPRPITPASAHHKQFPSTLHVHPVRQTCSFLRAYPRYLYHQRATVLPFQIFLSASYSESWCTRSRSLLHRSDG